VAKLAAALSKLMLSYGTKIADPDYTGVKLMLSTPSHTGRPEFEYKCSLDETKRIFDSRGITIQNGWELFNADIASARARLVSEFLRTDFTHLLMIDDDMGWEMSAIDRLFYVDEPFVGIVGPKKSYPLRFAGNHIDKDGNPIPLHMDPEKGAAEVSMVGAAFVLLRRDMLEIMTDAYSELKYIGPDARECTALFCPFVRDKNYFQEDFAFSQRWKDIGGKIFICPDVKLKHVGRHVFEGCIAFDQGKLGP
jgi:hypothetical protein